MPEKIGGILALLVFAHFAIDWLSQTDTNAKLKSSHWPTLFWHSFTYACLMTPLMFLGSPSPMFILQSWLLLFTSHIIIDTYFPVFYWAKYIRRIPGLRVKQDLKTVFETDPLSMIVCLVADQLFHVAVLVALASVLVRYP